jgi:hypothetical protein
MVQDADELGLTRRASRRVYVDGQSGTEYDALRISRPRFTSDGRHSVYAVYHVQENSRNVSFVVTDGAEGKRYDYLFAMLDIPGQPRRDLCGAIRPQVLSGDPVAAVTPAPTIHADWHLVVYTWNGVEEARLSQHESRMLLRHARSHSPRALNVSHITPSGHLGRDG